MKASESTKVPTSLWVESRIIMAKSHLFDKEIGKAIETLKDICFLLPPFPIDELPFIESVISAKPEDDELSMTNKSQNEERSSPNEDER
jgi:hypothetical protein